MSEAGVGDVGTRGVGWDEDEEFGPDRTGDELPEWVKDKQKRLEKLKINTHRQAQEVSADAGYRSEGNLKELNRRHIEAYVATERQKHGQASATRDGNVQAKPRINAMRQKLQRGGRRTRYRLRKQVVEPVFGQIKHGRGFRQFLMRGIEKVSGEWSLMCSAHNLLKLAAATG